MNKWKRLVRSGLTLLLTAVMLVTSVPISVKAASTADTIYTFLREELGLNTAAACGVLANIEKESNFNPNAYGDHGTSYGICQWHNSRFTSLRNWCASHGYNYTTLEGQLHFMQYELSARKSTYQKLLAVPNTAGGAYNAAYDWCYYYEVPANRQAKAVQRGKLAKTAYWPKYSAPEPKVTATEECRYTLTVAAKTGDVALFGTATTYVEAERFFHVGNKKLTIPCTKKVTLSDKSVRYMFTDNQGNQFYVQWDSKHMTVKKTHVWGAWAVTKIPTCTTTGAHTRTCTCGAEEESKIKKTPHNYVATSCTKRKTCADCGKVSSDPPDHSYSNNCDATCNLCDHTRKVGDHKWTDGYCAYCRLLSPTKVKIAAQPKSITVDKGAYASATVKATGEGLTYTWYIKDTDDKAFGRSAQCGNTYKIKITKDNNGRQAYCVVKDKYGNAKQTKTVTLKTATTSISQCKVRLSATAFTYSGKVKKPAVTVKDAKGNALKKGTDYTVTYAAGCKQVSTYTVTVKMRGYYTGAKTLSFTIKPYATSVKSLTAGAKSLTVAVNRKYTQISGYQIQYSADKSFKTYKTKLLFEYTNTSKTIYGLASKKTYYVRVRTFKLVDGKRVYSNWSAVKKKKTL